MLAWAIDVVLLVAFVLIGRASHGEGLAGFVTTLLPFLVGFQTGWLLRSGQPPFAVLRSGAVVWLATLVLGLALRALSGGGTAPSFVVVTAVVLGVFFLGWRALAVVVGRLLGRRGTPARRRLGGGPSS